MSLRDKASEILDVTDRSRWVDSTYSFRETQKHHALSTTTSISTWVRPYQMTT